MDPNVFETANAGFAQVMYEEFLRDPTSVDSAWRQLFESGVVGEVPALNGTDRAPKTEAPEPPTPAAAAVAAPVAPPQGASAAAVPIKGPAARLVQNMNESLTVPTATTFRELPVAQLEHARKSLNAALKQAGRKEKISFTHLIAWAIVRATKQHPVMGHTYAEQDGKPTRVTPTGINLGLAVDVTRKDGSRGLVVPVIKRCGNDGFRRFSGHLRRPGGEGPGKQAHAGRLCRRHHVADQPRWPGHSRVGAPTDGGTGKHHCGRLYRIPAGVCHGGGATGDRARHLEGDDGQQHLRSPHHSRRRIGCVPRSSGRTPAGRKRLLRRRGKHLGRDDPGRAAGDGRHTDPVRRPRRRSRPRRSSTSLPAWRW